MVEYACRQWSKYAIVYKQKGGMIQKELNLDERFEF